jgi:mRNA interferase MazF
VKRGEIWIASLEPNKGSEVGKQRPILIIQTDLLNQIGHPTVLILPISSQMQDENILRYKLEHSSLEKKLGFVLVDQIRAIDAKLRLKKNIGSIDSIDLNNIHKLVLQVLE